MEAQFDIRAYFEYLVTNQIDELNGFVYETEAGQTQARESDNHSIYPCLALTLADGKIEENQGDTNLDVRTESIYLSAKKSGDISEAEQWTLLRQLRNQVIAHMKYWEGYPGVEGETLREILNIADVRYYAQSAVSINNSFGYLIEFDCTEVIDLSL
ncbi:hypothetical protein BKI52_12535 [marine bacterium AO1-C]|nr:hypothetical protein BKI52_12535 [marine bacterium AO1-C]